jgi:hypothetical protein
VAIILNKTLQGVTYDLYIKTDMRLDTSTPEKVSVVQHFYTSQGHFDDGFLPIIRRELVITNQQRVNSIKLLLRESYKEAINVAENFFVNNVAFYQGGTVVNGEVV